MIALKMMEMMKNSERDKWNGLMHKPGKKMMMYRYFSAMNFADKSIHGRSFITIYESKHHGKKKFIKKRGGSILERLFKFCRISFLSELSFDLTSKIKIYFCTLISRLFLPYHNIIG